MNSHFFLLSQLVRRDLFGRFAASFGGAVWIFLNPAILCGLYAFVFGAILRIPPPVGFRAGFLEYLLSGLIPWLGLNEAVLRGASAVTDHAELVKKTKFPVSILVVSSLASALVVEAAGLVLVAGLSAVRAPGALRPGLLLVALGVQALLLVGPLFALAAANVYFRDLPQLLAPGLTVVFYLTPIVYPAALVPAPWSRALGANPVALVVDLFRAALFSAPAPALVSVVSWSVLGAVLGSLGLAVFRRASHSFSDLL